MNQDLMSLLMPSVKPAPAIRVKLNSGHLMDIPTGSYLKQHDGTYVLNGGLANLVGISGLPNTLKSTIMHAITLTAADRLIANNLPTNITTYDTENTLEHSRMMTFLRRFKHILKLGNPFDLGIWIVTNKSSIDGTEWWSNMRTAATIKVKERSKLTVDTPFADENGNPFRALTPTFSQIDTLTMFGGKDSAELDEKVDLADKKGLTKFMKEGLAKARLLTMLPKVAEQSNSYYILTSHVGDTATNLDNTPSYIPPDKNLPTLKSNQRYKGVTDNFFYLLGDIWQTHTVRPLLSDTKEPLYPVGPDDNTKMDTDLVVVKLQLMRSKSSADGIMLNLIVSKTEGVLEYLSAFHLLRTEHYYGLEGSKIHYTCALYPDVKLQRTTIRAKLNEDELLCNAIYRCAEMYQIYLYRKYPDNKFRVSPAELYQSLLDKGYDWTKILSARHWHSLGKAPPDTKTITTMDLLAIHAGELERPDFK